MEPCRDKLPSALGPVMGNGIVSVTVKILHKVLPLRTSGKTNMIIVLRCGMNREDFSEIAKRLREKIDALRQAKNTREHNLYVEIHNQYNYTLLLVDLVNRSPEMSQRMLLQLLSDCGIIHFVRIFSHVEFNVKRLMLLTQDSRLEDLRRSITERKKPVYLYDILNSINRIQNIDTKIEKWKKLMHIRNIIVHNNEIADTTRVYSFDKDSCYGKDYGKIILKKNKRIVLSSPDLLIRLTDLLVDSYEFLALALVGCKVIDIDVINRTKW